MLRVVWLGPGDMASQFVSLGIKLRAEMENPKIHTLRLKKLQRGKRAAFSGVLGCRLVTGWHGHDVNARSLAKLMNLQRSLWNTPWEGYHAHR